MATDPSIMDDDHLASELRKAGDKLDAWRTRGLPKTIEELDEHWQDMLNWHALAREDFTRRQIQKQGRKSPWN